MSSPRGKTSSTSSGSNLLYFLIAFRICNALLIRTFFQPDEYFQSLEPAWSIAFGASNGAWITWEWKERLRSSLHPILFAAVYRAAVFAADALGLGSTSRAEILLVAPKILQAVFAALTDYFIWQLARKIHGKGSQASTAALLLTIFSPWQWFCSVRTLSNCLETTLTTLALWLWPFRAIEETKAKSMLQQEMRAALALAAVATVLRPTNAIIWAVVALSTAIGGPNHDPKRMFWALLLECREAIVSGVAVLAISVLSDRFYYAEWTFPPLRFVHFNVVQSLAVFYGRNRGDYYLTEGLPLLLTTALPFAAVGCWQAFFSKGTDAQSHKTTRPLASSVLVFTAIMSIISHKEVRFIYPLLPALLVLAAGPFASFFSPLPRPRPATKKTLLLLMLVINSVLAFYISQVHQRGVIDVMHFLRHEYKQEYLETRSNMTAMFLMPCHSTPWRSHLVYSGIDARALTCEPPLDVPIEARASYLDEADQFYADPIVWMRENMEDTKQIEIGPSKRQVDIRAAKAQWPDYVAFFEQLEPTMRDYLVGTGYRQCWKGFNTHWHDDSRRQGDVIVWCLKGEEV